MTIQEMLEAIPLLSIAERKQLIHVLVDSPGEPTQAKNYRYMNVSCE